MLTVHQLGQVYKSVVESLCEGIKSGVATLLHDDQSLLDQNREESAALPGLMHSVK